MKQVMYRSEESNWRQRGRWIDIPEPIDAERAKLILDGFLHPGVHHFEIRERSVVDGIYAQIDTVGAVNGTVYTRFDGDWYEGSVLEDGTSTNASTDDMNDRAVSAGGYVRLVVAK